LGLNPCLRKKRHHWYRKDGEFDWETSTLEMETAGYIPELLLIGEDRFKKKTN
jgi:hypothetical protein